MEPLAALFVRVTHLNTSLQFYSTILGITFEQNNPDIAIGKVGNLTIVLQEGDRPIMTPAISFAVDNLEEVFQKVQANGGRVNQEITDGPMGKVANLTDNEGNPLEFVELKK